MYFLDSVLFQRSIGQIVHEKQLDLGSDLRAFVGNLDHDRAYVATFFRSTHSWAPFIAKGRFLARVFSPLHNGSDQIGNMLLLASMKLIAGQLVPNGEPYTAAYDTIKTTLAHAHNSGLLDLYFLQSLVIVSLYELGNAMYPAAYFTVGSCIRLGYALGIDKSIENAAEPRFDGIESEERRRTWWMVILLDR